MQKWIELPANSDDPPVFGGPSALPQIIYAVRKPRLTAQVLRARQQSAGAAPSMAERRDFEGRAASPVLPLMSSAARRKACAFKLIRWSMLALTFAALSAGTPVP